MPMEHGKHVAIRGALELLNMHEIWDLINLSEKTRKHCMILENCFRYDFFELNSLNMAQRTLR